MMEKNLRNKKRSFFTDLRRSKELRKAILEHGAYHDMNIDKVIHSVKADNFYTKEEKVFLKVSMLYDHFKVQKYKEKELEVWNNDKSFLAWLDENEKTTYYDLLKVIKSKQQ